MEIKIKRMSLVFRREILIERTRTRGSPWLGERFYINGYLVIIMRVDLSIW